MELGVKHHTESQRNRGFGVWGLRPQINNKIMQSSGLWLFDAKLRSGSESPNHRSFNI